MGVPFRVMSCDLNLHVYLFRSFVFFQLPGMHRKGAKGAERLWADIRRRLAARHRDSSSCQPLVIYV